MWDRVKIALQRPGWLALGALVLVLTVAGCGVRGELHHPERVEQQGDAGAS